MAVKASASITLSFMVDVQAVFRYYKLQSSTAASPNAPSIYPPEDWSDTEPGYSSGSTNTLYFVDCTIFADDSFVYSLVSKSSSYEAAKEAYNKANAAQNTANNAANEIAATQSTLSKWFTFDDELGFVVQKPAHVDSSGVVHPASIWYTVTDETGYHICRSDMAAYVGSFAREGLEANEIQIAEIVCRKTSSGGWVWTDAQ